MKISCVWEHNGSDTLLYAVELPGAYARGESREAALEKMKEEAASYLRWRDGTAPENITVEIAQDAPCTLDIRDADSDVLFDAERAPLCREEYERLKALALRSAADFLALYRSIPNKEESVLPLRKTFYGQVPRTAEEMYRHTKNVNEYYFGEIGVEADNEGSILDCRRRGFAALEQQPDFLANPVFEGSWGESWTLRKLLRRFLWHDRIHARAMYRMALRTFGTAEDVFSFGQKERGCVMVFNFDNQMTLEDIYFHDSVFEGFACDYDRRQVRFDLRHGWSGKRYHLCFRNVVALEMQGCAFWGGGNSVYHLWIDENPDYFRRFVERHRQEPYKCSLLDERTCFMSVIMQLHSGDELRLTCESVEVTEEDLEK